MSVAYGCFFHVARFWTSLHGVLALAALATRPRWRSGVRSHRRVARHLSAPRALPDFHSSSRSRLLPRLHTLSSTTSRSPRWRRSTGRRESRPEPPACRPPPSRKERPSIRTSPPAPPPLPSLCGAQVVEDIPQTAARDVPSLLGSAVRDGPALAQGAAPALFSLLQDASRVFNLETQTPCAARPRSSRRRRTASSARAAATRRTAAHASVRARRALPATHISCECTCA